MIEAAIGLVGVIVGSSITWVKDLWLERQNRKRAARYLAIRVITLLDRYLDQIIDVVYDEGEPVLQHHGQEELRPTVKTPDPIELPRDVNWESINHDLMYQLLSLPNTAWEAEKHIQHVAEDIAGPPCYEEYFEERRERYATIGLKVYGLASDLRREFSIPQRDFGDWDPIEFLRDAKARVEQARLDRRPDWIDNDIEEEQKGTP